MVVLYTGTSSSNDEDSDFQAAVKNSGGSCNDDQVEKGKEKNSRASAQATSTPMPATSRATSTTVNPCSSSASQPRTQPRPTETCPTTPSSTSNTSAVILFNPYATGDHRKPDLTDPPLPPVAPIQQQRRPRGVRQRRRRLPANRVAVPQDHDEILRKRLGRMSLFDRFYSSLLESAASDYWQAASTQKQKQFSETALYTRICARAGLPVVTTAASVAYLDDTYHCSSRASLVLEEARHAVATAMDRIWSERRNRNRLIMQLVDQKKQHKDDEGTKWVFRNNTTFTKDQLHHIRPGTVVQILERGNNRKVGDALLGVIVTGNRDTIERGGTFAVLCYNATFATNSSTADYEVTPLASLVSACRSFNALLSPTLESLDFFTTLVSGKLVGPKPVGTATTTTPLKPTASGRKQIVPQENTYFRLPLLNRNQENAATSFLKSKPGTITLVQGPPGTGKTTLLVSIISRLLLKARTEGADDYRLMVCAPTNKAVTVVARRFLDSIQEDNRFSVLLVGDADKLLTDERNVKQNSSNSLQSVFLYSWMQSVVDGYNDILAFCRHKRNMRDTVRFQAMGRSAHALERRLKQNLRNLPQNVFELVDAITNTLDSVEFGGNLQGIVQDIGVLIQELQSLSPEQVSSQLLRAADVIFCTLVSSGGSAVKRTDPVSDLIVEEAAAATEPEIYIPFHLKPSRLLAVGDPKQLPATVLSRAGQLGLSKSLHERLMFDCNYPHVMLDIQYRMSCEISDFPSKCFYDSKIGNGSNVSNAQYLEGPVLLDKLPYAFYQIAGKEEQSTASSFYNRSEALAVVELVSQLRKQGNLGSTTWHSTDRIRIITFYNAQVMLIRRILQEQGLSNKVLVATVDSSQGCEADIVLISFVRSPSDRGHHSRGPSAGFLTDDRRMNVALTRARFQLVCVGNVRAFHTLARAETLHRLAADAETRGVIRTFSQADQVNERLDAFYGPRGENKSNKRPKTSI